MEVEAMGRPTETKSGLGMRSWLIVVAGFVINGLMFGTINSYSVIYFELQRVLKESGTIHASYKASLIGSLSVGTTLAFSPVAVILVDKLGHRVTALIGAFFAILGMFSSSYLTECVEALYLTYGVLFGLGVSLAFTPALAILGLHFKENLGIVSGFVNTGSAVFTIAIPPILKSMINDLGLNWALRIAACCMLLIPVVAIALKPPAKKAESSFPQEQNKRPLFNLEIWKSKKFIIWAIGAPFSLFGYLVAFVHIVKFASINFPDHDGKILVMCIGLATAFGRVFFGVMSDVKSIEKILLQQISFFAIGLLTILLVYASSWTVMIFIAFGLGFFDGCFMSLVGPIAYDMFAPEDASQAIGFLLGLCSIPLTVGPPVAGMLFDQSQSYDLPFFVAGVPTIVGSLILFAARCVKH
ncbi:Hypothetical predicted protein [Cloeon dipterum]|uniref:Major facilitator superfamily (MFS) profile domain-containing protein n=1 Tax=Cloeon dipterum TaxID=197152 RepID=A0A8S1CPS2_9INSE|nr:Hypothetical predicted protein [Cloeon dipterum]